MASFEKAESLSYIAGAATTGDLYTLAKVSAARTAVKVAALTDNPIGVIAEEVSVAGAELPIVMLMGIVKIKASGVIAAGALCKMDAAGTVSSLASISALLTNEKAVGVAVTAAGAANEIIEMQAMLMTGEAT